VIPPVTAPKNTLNDLDAKSWVKSTKSWFVVNPRSRLIEQLHHPAKYPEELAFRFINFFTQKGNWILDPFVGVGSTLIACKESGRNAVGIELQQEFVESGKKQLLTIKGSGEQHFLLGDSQYASALITKQFGNSPPVFDYLITSPPYWNMLHKSRGGNDSIHKQRERQGLKQFYSESDRDLGNITDYEEYIHTLGSLFSKLKPLLKKKAYLTVVIQNMRDTDGKLKPIAWDLAKVMSLDFELCQEMIWCQDNKKLGCWGYPTTYISNVHHHYCLIFQNCL
jgi:DNA modification methylase